MTGAARSHAWAERTEVADDRIPCPARIAGPCRGPPPPAPAPADDPRGRPLVCARRGGRRALRAARRPARPRARGRHSRPQERARGVVWRLPAPRHTADELPAAVSLPSGAERANSRLLGRDREDRFYAVRGA